MAAFDLDGATQEQRDLADRASRRLFGKALLEVAGAMEKFQAPFTEEVFGALVLTGQGIQTLNKSVPEDLMRLVLRAADVVRQADEGLRRAAAGGPLVEPIIGKRITEIDLVRKQEGARYERLTATVDEAGRLVLEGQDMGPGVEAHWGDSDYEYGITVDKDYVGTTLLHLLKERFDSSLELKAWLRSHAVPFGFWSY